MRYRLALVLAACGAFALVVGWCVLVRGYTRERAHAAGLRTVIALTPYARRTP